MISPGDSNRHYIILGASLTTGNLGVSALLASTVKCVLRAHPIAKISLLEGMRDPIPEILELPDGSTLELERIGVRVNKTLWRQNHLVRLILTALFLKCVPTAGWREKLRSRNPYLKQIYAASGVLDITGGDSFSDIYGMRRLVLSGLRKWLVLLCGRPLTLLPQTYGPFKRSSAKMIARFILGRAAQIFSRDREGLEQVGTLMRRRKMRAAAKLCPDVAFTMDAIAPDSPQVSEVKELKNRFSTVVGLNVSGLLYNGGYTQDNMFGLACDYKKLVRNILDAFLKRDDCAVLLTPHVIPRDYAVENDAAACHEIWKGLSAEQQKRVIVLDGCYNQNQVKYFIGQCDFFMGARMHSTIAALSQGVAAAGLAYSKKFAGVFETVGAADCVVDIRVQDEEQAIEQIEAIYQRRDVIAETLAKSVPAAKQQVFQLFESL